MCQFVVSVLQQKREADLLKTKQRQTVEKNKLTASKLFKIKYGLIFKGATSKTVIFIFS